MSETERLVYAQPARVKRAAERDVSGLLRLARERHAFDASVFEEHEPFFWRAEISSTRLDAYYTHMALSTLEKFAVFAAEGVSFQNSHRNMDLPLGRSLTGSVTQDGELATVEADFYTLAGLTLNGVNTDDFITGVRSGIIHDVSVGFFGGRYICDICHGNYLSWDCPHWAGREYEIEPDGGEKRTVLCTVRIEDAELCEVSAVYDGATPGAVILKAERGVESGRLSPSERKDLEGMYRMRLAGGVDSGLEAHRNDSGSDGECWGCSVAQQRATRARELRLVEA